MHLLNKIVSRGSWLVSDFLFKLTGLYCLEVNSPTMGFFAQLGSLLPLLVYCHDRQLKPHIVLSSHLYAEDDRGFNFLDYFFTGPTYTAAQRRLLQVLPIRKSRSFVDIQIWSRYTYPSLDTSAAFFRQYYRLRPEFAMEADNFAQRHFIPGRTLGVHYRGTDKATEASEISFEYTLQCIKQCRRQNPALDTVFVATDTTEYLEFLRRELQDVRLVVRDEIRSPNDKPVHLSGLGTPYQNGRDALLSSLLLSRCDVLLKTMSNLSGWAKVFNPELPVHIMNRPDKAGIAWLGFPEREMIEKQWFAVALPI